MSVLLRVLKWVGIVVGGLVALVVIAVGVLLFLGSSRINKTYDIDVAPVAVPTDQASIERGQHLVASWLLCTECHGEGFRGDVMDDDPVFGGWLPATSRLGRVAREGC